MERVELRLAAQYKCVFDVGESLQNLEKGIHVSEKAYSLSIIRVLDSVIKSYLSKIKLAHFILAYLPSRIVLIQGFSFGRDAHQIDCTWKKKFNGFRLLFSKNHT